MLVGLMAARKQLSPKFFYDEKGSKLFEAITELPEYYLTRTELAIFDASLDELAAAIPEGSCVAIRPARRTKAQPIASNR